MASPTAKLEALLIKEVSGVDDPANEIPGWMVAKSADGGAQTLIGRLHQRLSKGTTEGTDIDVDAEQLTEAVEAAVEKLGDSLVERLSKSVAPAEGEGAPAVEETVATEATKSAEEIEAEKAAAAQSLTDAITKAVEDALQPVLEVLDKALDRIAGTEKALGIAARKSLDGQESGEATEEATPTLKSAIGAALAGHTVNLR